MTEEHLFYTLVSIILIILLTIWLETIKNK